MNSLVIYDSQFGNTKQVAEAIAEALGTEVHHISDVTSEDIGNANLLVVGCPTQGMGPTEATQDLLKGLPDGLLRGVHVAAFDTRFDFDSLKKPLARLATGFLKMRFAAKPLEALLTAKGGQPVIEPGGFLVEGNEGPLKDGELERAAEWAKRIKLLYASA